ncbi:T9SS type B sorting domain-containing protein [Winogradskyella sp.]|uniref:T9SS type B sorting domain-containing protein n=1 Tax=Winogradskyella sp. TaxID=1883156 RepID=UPI0025E8B327|nr:T9SS type B sorting domain-containing protein [Winogradskyella sp.]
MGLTAQINSPGGVTCDIAGPICSDTSGSFVFENNNDPSTNINNSIACLQDGPRPAWFFLKVDQTGDLEFQIIQESTAGVGLDVDFVLWGPFLSETGNCNNIDFVCNPQFPNSPANGCPNNTTNPGAYPNANTNIVDCSYSPNSIENMTIPNAVSGEFYLLLVTNFDGGNGTIEIVQTNFGNPGGGSTDCDIINADGILGPDLSFCGPGSTTLDANPANDPSFVDFAWEFNDGTGFAPIAGTDGMSSISVSNTGEYQVTITDTNGNSDDDLILVTIFDLPILATTLDATICSDEVNNVVLDVESGSVAAAAYNITAINTNGLVASAGAPVVGNGFTANEIADDAYTNTTNTPVIVTYTIVPVSADNCEGNPFDINVTINPEPVLSTTLDTTVCSDDASGIVLDIAAGSIMATTYNIISIDTNGLVISAGTPTVGVGFGANEIVDDAYTNTTGVPVVVTYIVVPASADNCEGNPVDVNLTVNPEPVLSTTLDIPVCSEVPSGLLLDVELGSVAAATYNITAINTNGLVASAGLPVVGIGFGANEIADDAYTNNTNAPVIVTYTIVPISADNCLGEPLDVNLTINPLPVITNTVDLLQCDNDTDGFSDFNLTEAEILISTNAANETFTYYLTPADAANGTNAIANPTAYTNTDPSSNPDIIYVRVESAALCFRVAQLNLFVSATQIPANIEILYEVCDSDAVDNDIANGIESFDFSDAEAQIRTQAMLPVGQNLTFTFYESQADALAEINAIPDISNHRNDASPFEQEIYVRVDSDVDNACVGLGIHVRLRTINPTPNLNPDPIILCDDVTVGDLSEEFNLTIREAFIFNGDPDVTATYHTTFAGANASDNSIPTPAAYNNTNPSETIFVRVTNTITTCYAIVELDILVNPLPDDNVVIADFFECENNTDFVVGFDLDSKTDEILNGQDAMQFAVTYHETQADADNLVNPLTSPYDNISNPQPIFVAVTNTTTGCSISTLSFNIEVNEDAEATNDFYEECDEVNANDGSTQFDLASRIPIILNGQDPNAFSIAFFDDLDEANNNELSEQLPLLYENITNPQIIYARVSNVIRPDECFAVAEVILQTNLLPIFDLEDEYILCLSSNNEAVVDVPPVLDTGLSDSDYTFEWSLDGNVLPAQTGSSLIPIQGGTYEVVVTDVSTSAVTMCTDSDSAEVIESALPDTFDVDVISEAFTGNNIILATAGGISTYEYSLDNGAWQLDNEFSDVDGGDHVVAVRDVNGCGIVTRNVTVIDFPKFFTPNGDGTNDTWNIEGISTQPSAIIFIFDRYGKLLKQLSPTSPGWDGTFQGNNMPSTDYWFRLEYIEPINNEMRTFTSHFALKR